jgi:hypothetical protein
MVFPILGANTESAAYEISNSLRFDDGDSAYLNRTPSSASNRRTWTWSGWFKRSNLGALQDIFIAGSNASGQLSAQFSWNSSDGITIYATVSGGSADYYLVTNALFRDPSAWYHLVLAVDTTQGTNSNRIKLYVNGEQVTSFSSETYPSQNYDSAVNNNVLHTIGRFSVVSANPLDAYLSEVHFIDGSQLTPSSFGETNDNGVWIPKDCKADLTYGTNGFYLEFQQTGTSANSSGMGADTSGNDHHWTPNNLAATDVTVDTPTNNFMTMNPLFTNSRGTFAEGNLKVTTNVQGSVPYGQVEFGNFAVNKGKWYYEVKVTSVGSGGSLGLGWNERAESGGYTNGHNNGGSAGNVRYNSGGVLGIGSSHSQSTGVDSFTDNDIIGFALDLDNNKVYAYKNGNPQDDPTPDPDDNDGRAIVSAYNNYWTPWMSKDDTNHNATVEFNFGNPSFSISSGNADGNGYGNFEYAVPTNYYSLCTKNLAEYG